MANRERGEFEVQIAGVQYTLVMNTNALAAAQEALSTPKEIAKIEDIYQAVNNGSVKHVIVFFWAALRKYHPLVTVEQAGELIDAAGGLSGFGPLMSAVNARSEPDKADVQELRRANPPRARANGTRGRGERSISTHAKSA